MSDPFEFADRLNHCVERSAYTPGQLSTLSDIPKSTIVNWLQGRVARPRDWQAVVRLLRVLHLSEREADEVLRAAGQPVLAELQRLATEEERELLVQWQLPIRHVLRSVPFQAIPNPSHFVGREEEVKQLAEWLQAGELCIVQGLPGVGKTALAARIAYHLRPQLADGVLWARVSGSGTSAILNTFARAYGVDVSDLPDVDSRGRVVRELLADKQALVVLDDSPESATVEPLLPPSGRCAVLITTRRQNLRAGLGSRRLSLAPFSTESATARQLFAQILGEERVAAEAALFDQIAALLGQLPLALLIVASRLAYEPGWSTVALLERLQRRQQRWEALAFEDLSLRLSLEVGLEELSSAEHHLFTTLSVFPASFSAGAVATIAGLEEEKAEEGLRSLHARSLAQVSQGQRYELHPLLRDFADTLLREEDGSKSEAQRRFVSYYRHFLQEHARPLSTRSIRAVVTEEANIEAALTIAWSLGEPVTYTEMVLDFVPHLEQRGLLDKAEVLLSQALTVLKGTGATEARIRLAILFRRRRQYERAECTLAEVESAWANGKGEPSPVAEAALLIERGIIAACRHDYSEATRLFARAAPAARKSEDPSLLVTLLKEWGAAEVAQSRYEVAEAHYVEALALAREQTPVQVPTLLRTLGGLAVARDRDYESARSYYLAALEEARSYEAYPALPVLLNNLAVTAAAAGEVAQAEATLAEALALARQRGEPVTLAMIRLNLGRLALYQGEVDTGQQCLEEALSHAELAAHASLSAAIQAALAQAEEEYPAELPALTVIFD